MNIMDKPNIAKSLIEIVQGLKTNTFKWARVWTLNGTPEDRYPNEHHVITQALVRGSSSRCRHIRPYFEDAPKGAVIPKIVQLEAARRPADHLS